MVLVGPSSCGKTKLLRMIDGLEDMADGQIWIGDPDVTGDIAKVSLRALPPCVDRGEPRSKVCGSAGCPSRNRGARPFRREDAGARGATRTSACGALPAGSTNASAWAARSYAILRRSSWISCSQTSTPSCSLTCGPSSCRCVPVSIPPPCRSRMARSRRWRLASGSRRSASDRGSSCAADRRCVQPGSIHPD
jgi:energy-coupling factor transporter ATP-binding protein EcfA2